MLHAAVSFSSFPRVTCDRVRVRVPEPHVSVQEPHMDHSAHPAVVVANVVVAIVVAGTVVVTVVLVVESGLVAVVDGASVVVSAPVAGS